MEYTKSEVSIVEETIQQANDTQMLELVELQLAYIGGGIADPIAA